MSFTTFTKKQRPILTNSEPIWGDQRLKWWAGRQKTLVHVELALENLIDYNSESNVKKPLIYKNAATCNKNVSICLQCFNTVGCTSKVSNRSKMPVQVYLENGMFLLSGQHSTFAGSSNPICDTNGSNHNTSNCGKTSAFHTWSRACPHQTCCTPSCSQCWSC